MDAAAGMTSDRSDTVNLSAGKAAAYAEKALRRIGLCSEEAQTIAAQLVDSALRGYPAFGLARVLTISEHPRINEPRRPIAIVHETPVSARIDGGKSLGYRVRSTLPAAPCAPGRHC